MTQYKKKDLYYWWKRFLNDVVIEKYNDARRFLRKIKYKIKYVFFPNNVLKIKTLPRHWMDRDEVLLHACFQILTDYVERECSNEYFNLQPFDIEKEMESYKDWDEKDKEGMRKGLEEQNRVTAEIKFLYDWWKKREGERKAKDPLNKLDDIPEKDCTFDDKSPIVVKRDEYGDPLLYQYESRATPEHRAIYDESHKFDEACDKEDEEMLIRLMKIRKCLWT